MLSNGMGNDLQFRVFFQLLMVKCFEQVNHKYVDSRKKCIAHI